MRHRLGFKSYEHPAQYIYTSTVYFYLYNSVIQVKVKCRGVYSCSVGRITRVFSTQVKVMLDILLYFNWTYVSAVYSEGWYGESAVDQLKVAAASNGICVGLTVALPEHTDVSHAVHEVISKLIEINAQVVILFTHLEETKTIFSAVQQQQLIGRCVSILYNSPSEHLANNIK